MKKLQWALHEGPKPAVLLALILSSFLLATSAP